VSQGCVCAGMCACVRACVRGFVAAQLFELLTGEVPWAHPNKHELFRLIIGAKVTRAGARHGLGRACVRSSGTARRHRV
jgi:hypothetical protein